MEKILFIGSGGFIGAVMRYWISGWVYEKWGTAYPYGTFVVNIAGAFLLGLIMSATEEHLVLPAHIKMAVTVGILGAFTTFSTFCYESMMLIQEGNVLRAFLNIAVSLLVGLVFVFVGIKAGKLI